MCLAPSWAVLATSTNYCPGSPRFPSNRDIFSQPPLSSISEAVHMLSLLAHFPSPRSSLTAGSSPITPPKLLLQKGPNCLYVAKTSGHFSDLSYLDTYWPAAPLTGSCFLQQSPTCASQRPHLLPPPSPLLAPPPSPDVGVVPPAPSMC